MRSNLFVILFLCLIFSLAKPTIAGSTTMKKDGSAITQIIEGIDGDDFNNSSFPRGVLISSVANVKYKFYLPNTTLSTIVVRIHGDADWVYQRNIEIGDVFKELSDNDTINTFIFQESELTLAEDSLCKELEVEFLAENSIPGYNYDLDYIEVTYFCEDIPIQWLEYFQLTSSGYRALQTYKTEVVDTDLWNKDVFVDTTDFLFEKYMETISVAQNISVNGNVDLTATIQNLNTFYDWYFGLIFSILNKIDESSFWFYYNLSSSPNLRSDSPNLLQESINKLYTLSTLLLNSISTQELSIGIGESISEVETKIGSLQTEIENAYNKMYDIYSNYNNYNGENYSEVMIVSLMSLMKYDYTEPYGPLNQNDSYLPKYISAISLMKQSFNGSLTVTINPSEVQGSAMWKLTSGPYTNWNTSGDIINGIPTGSYTLEFIDVIDWTKPPSRTITINEGSNTEHGTYLQQGPESISLTSIADAIVREDNPTENYGDSPILFIDISAGSDSYGLIKFDLSSIPTGSTIDSVELKLNVAQYPPSPPAHEIQLLEILISWDESTVNWNDETINSYSDPRITTDIVDQGNTVWVWNSTTYPSLKTLAQDWLNTPSTNHGMSIVGGPGQLGVSFYSREDINSSRWPELMISYTPPPKPTSPSNLSHSGVSTNSITWQWHDNSSNEDVFKGHDSSDNEKWMTGPNVESKVESGLIPNTQHTRHVHAYNSSGNSSETNSHSVYTAANIPGGDSFSNITSSSIQANWTANGNPTGTLYFCENITAGTNSGWITDTFWDSIGISFNTSYSLRVKARNSEGIETAWTDLGSIYTLAIAPSPDTLSGVDSSTIQAKWTANGNPTGAEYYCENITNDSNSGWTTNTYWNSTGLDSATEYLFQVKARSGDNIETAWTDLGSIYTLATDPSPIPFSGVDCNNIQANWDANGNSVEAEYYCENITNDTNSGWITDTFWNSTGLSLTTTYSFRVKVRNGNGIETGTWIDLGSETTHIPPIISNVSPASGPYKTCMTIEGQNFYNWGTVVFPDGNTAEIIGWTDSVIYCRAPESGLSGNIVVNRGLNSNPFWFTFTDPNVIYVNLNHTPNIENGTNQYPFGKIQYGIDAADSNDEVIIADGIYTGDGNRDISLWEKPITVRSENGPQNCIVDCNGIDTDPHFGIRLSSESAGLEGITVRNGYNAYGGGIICQGGITVKDCIIQNNYATNGGGIYSVNYYTYRMDPNGGGGRGDGSGRPNPIPNFTENDPEISNCLIENNSAENGGGIQCTGDTIISNCIIQNNNATYGGGVLFSHAMGDWKELLFFLDGVWYSVLIPTTYPLDSEIVNCLITNNSAIYGGGICYMSPPDTNDIFVGPNIRNNTIVANSATYGGGIACYDNTYTSDGGNPETIITNTIIWNNNAPNGSQVFNSEDTPIAVSQGGEVKFYYPENHPICIVNFSNIQGGEQEVYDPNNHLVWNVGNINTDPNFVRLGYWDSNDTPSDPNDDLWIDGDYHLQSEAGRWDPNQSNWIIDVNTSPCIDAGNPGSFLEDEPNDINNIRINMGAYGGTSEASMSPCNWALLADMTNNGRVDVEDLSIQSNDWLNADNEQPGDLNRDGIVTFEDFALFAEDWMKETIWAGQ